MDVLEYAGEKGEKRGAEWSGNSVGFIITLGIGILGELPEGGRTPVKRSRSAAPCRLHRKRVERSLDSSSRQSAPPSTELCLPLYLVVDQLREDYGRARGEDDVSTVTMTEGEIEAMHDAIRDLVV